jgi:alginate O-acetyltransferase complex protein AlgI
MVVTSSAYFIFLAGIFLLYWPVAKSRALALAVILFANLFFYAKWDLFYLWMIPAAATIDFCLGLALGWAKNRGLRLGLVLLSIAMNVGILISFKYMPFLRENYGTLTGQEMGKWDWTFPLGISFYTFQSLTYTIDVYRKDAKPTGSLLAYLAGVCFFPTTLAGPITRVATLLPQFEKARSLSDVDGGKALFRIAQGLVKKFLIADYLADNLVNRVFDFPNLYSGTEVLVGVYAYALQLYFDFSGYSDIAIGSALLLGLKLPENFNQPYSAKNLSDFWRRWHISLSNWLRDYLYFSFPGMRTKWMPYIAIIVTMLVGGLWHGPSWNFVIWGALHGVGQAIVRGWQALRGPVGLKARWVAWLATFTTVQFVCFAWIFFRAPTLESAMLIIDRIASGTVAFTNVSAPIQMILAIAIAGHYLPAKWWQWTQERFVAAPFYAQAAALMLLMIGIQYVAATGAAPFIYTKF